MPDLRKPIAEPAPTPKQRLGEELPVFCEKCGYSLFGSPQVRCDRCEVLQFHCPECGHHQAINTLRPAFQAILGRIRAITLVVLVLVRIAFFGLLLFAWFIMGMEWSYRWNPGSYQRGSNEATQIAPDRIPAENDLDRLLAFGIFGFLFGAASRMLLLRWRRGPLVGVVIAALVVGAVMLGAWVQWYDSTDEQFPYPRPFTPAFVQLLGYASAIIVVGATVSWTIWKGLVTVFLPKRAAAALLAWQNSMSDPRPASGRIASDLARDPPNPIPMAGVSSNGQPGANAPRPA
jgi:hypothetical protein